MDHQGKAASGGRPMQAVSPNRRTGARVHSTAAHRRAAESQCEPHSVTPLADTVSLDDEAARRSGRHEQRTEDKGDLRSARLVAPCPRLAGPVSASPSGRASSRLESQNGLVHGPGVRGLDGAATAPGVAFSASEYHLGGGRGRLPRGLASLELLPRSEHPLQRLPQHGDAPDCRPDRFAPGLLVCPGDGHMRHGHRLGQPSLSGRPVPGTFEAPHFGPRWPPW
jgi:hypothetical protein